MMMIVADIGSHSTFNVVFNLIYGADVILLDDTIVVSILLLSS